MIDYRQFIPRDGATWNNIGKQLFDENAMCVSLLQYRYSFFIIINNNTGNNNTNTSNNSDIIIMELA